jgi:hypothetical protein
MKVIAKKDFSDFCRGREYFVVKSDLLEVVVEGEGGRCSTFSLEERKDNYVFNWFERRQNICVC